jgi:hypothetical protein
VLLAAGYCFGSFRLLEHVVWNLDDHCGAPRF